MRNKRAKTVFLSKDNLDVIETLQKITSKSNSAIINNMLNYTRKMMDLGVNTSLLKMIEQLEEEK